MNNKNSFTPIIKNGILAGMMISLGCMVFLKLHSYMSNDIIGSMLFSIGLFVICTKSYYLFTGVVCNTKQTNIKTSHYILTLVIVWIFNFIGCGIFFVITRFTRVFSDIQESAIDLVSAKMDDNVISLFLLGIICNICIYIAVNGYRKLDNPLGKYLSIFLGVIVFILCGSEHCVADMFYWLSSGYIFLDPVKSLLFIIVITLGNSVGGVIMKFLEK